MSINGLTKLAVIQMACGGEPDANLARAVELIEEAAGRGARLIGLPELFRSRYFCQREDARLFDLAEPVPGPTTKVLGEIARKLSVVIIAPVFERRAAGVYHNSAAVLDASGKVAGLYRKMHIPDDPAYYEKYYFTPGDLGFQAFDTEAGRVGVLICWDQWYPEGARLTALRGAEALFYPTAIGWHPREKEAHGAAQLDAWRTMQRAHAIANGVYVAVPNRVGHEKPEGGGEGIEFWGSSFIADPFGVVIAEASLDREEILIAEIDPARIEDVRRNWPFLRDRRVDAYNGLNQRLID
ncbi:MAG TPA: carbon-nitrogen hydrolase [Terriglobia bacterium]|nr:carbon-nitrogen hydrolase [Terriglobia bacterium]